MYVLQNIIVSLYVVVCLCMLILTYIDNYLLIQHTVRCEHYLFLVQVWYVLFTSLRACIHSIFNISSVYYLINNLTFLSSLTLVPTTSVLDSAYSTPPLNTYIRILWFSLDTPVVIVCHALFVVCCSDFLSAGAPMTFNILKGNGKNSCHKI